MPLFGDELGEDISHPLVADFDGDADLDVLAIEVAHDFLDHILYICAVNINIWMVISQQNTHLFYHLTCL